MTEQPEKRHEFATRRRLPDKWLALAIWLALLGLYLWLHDEAVKQMMFTAFGLLCVAISDGLRRVSDWSKRRLEARGRQFRKHDDANS